MSKKVVKNKTAVEAALEAAKLLAEHDEWEREQLEADSARLDRVESALIQINHFTEGMEKLDLVAWKSQVNTNIVWIKWLMGATTVAAIGQFIVGLFRGG